MEHVFARPGRCPFLRALPRCAVFHHNPETGLSKCRGTGDVRGIAGAERSQDRQKKVMALPMISTWKLGAVQILALGCLGGVMGAWLKKKLPVLDRLCIPTSIVGGLIFALAALALHGRYVNFEADTTLRDLL